MGDESWAARKALELYMGRDVDLIGIEDMLYKAIRETIEECARVAMARMEGHGPPSEDDDGWSFQCFRDEVAKAIRKLGEP